MNFLAPMFLLGAAAIAAPVLVHLIRRTTRVRRKFGSLMFLEQTPPRMTKRSRVEHWLLLLLRAAALVLLALAFARPFIQTPLPLAELGASADRTLILLDTSASMKRSGIWPKALAAATKAVDEAKGEVAVEGFDRAVHTAWSFDDWKKATPETQAILAKERIATLAASWNGTDISSALMAGAEMLAESQGKVSGQHTIVLVTDAQEGGRLERIQGYEWPKNVTLQLQTILPETAGNAGLQLAAGSDNTVRIRVSNTTDSTVEQFTLSSGAEVRDVYLPPGQSRVEVFTESSTARAFELKPDPASFDNILHVAPRTQHKLTVRHSGAPLSPRSPLAFLQKALPQGNGLTVEMSGDTLTPALWVVSASVPDAEAQVVKAYAEQGGTVLIMLDGEPMKSVLKAITQLELAREVRPADYALWGRIDFTHPLFAAFSEPRFSDFTKIRYTKYQQVNPAATKVLAAFDSGHPAVLETSVGKGRAIVLTASWTPPESQLALSSKFPSLIASLLDLTGTTRKQPTQLIAGEFAFPAPGPQGNQAVNVDPLESRTTAIPKEEFEKLGIPLQGRRMQSQQPIHTQLAANAETESKQKLWRWLLAGVLLLLLLETVVAFSTDRRKRRI